jgi:hypothetical protein
MPARCCPQDNPAWQNEIDRGWNVTIVSTIGTTLWTYDWPAGTASYPAVYLKSSMQQQPPPPLAASPPLAQGQNTPCEPPGGLCLAPWRV